MANLSILFGMKNAGRLTIIVSDPACVNGLGVPPYLLVSLTAVSINFSMAALSAQSLISTAVLLPLIDLGAAAFGASDLAGMV